MRNLMPESIRKERASSVLWLWLAVMAAYPVWWALGADQFIPSVASVVAALVLARRVQRRDMLTAFGVYFAFVLWQLVSLPQLESEVHFLAWTKNWLTYLGGGAAALVVAVGVGRSRMFAQAVVLVLACLGVLVSLVCCAHSFLGLCLEFVTPVGKLMPEHILAHDYPATVFIKSIGSQMVTYRGFPRSSGLFLYFNQAGLFCVVAGACQGYLGLRARSVLARVGWALAVVLSLGGLIASVSRWALIASVALGLAVLFLSLARQKSRLSRLQLGATVLALLVLALPATVATRELMTKRLGSFLYRHTALTYSLKLVLDKPLYGWGVQLDMSDLCPDVDPRVSEGVVLGSHSDYIAVVFRYGIVGLVLYLVFVALILMRGWKASVRAPTAPGPPLEVLAASLVVAIAVQGVAMELALDGYLFLVVATIWGLTLGLADGAPNASEEHRHEIR